MNFLWMYVPSSYSSDPLLSIDWKILNGKPGRKIFCEYTFLNFLISFVSLYLCIFNVKHYREILWTFFECMFPPPIEVMLCCQSTERFSVKPGRNIFYEYTFLNFFLPVTTQYSNCHMEILNLVPCQHTLVRGHFNIKWIKHDQC